MGDFTNEAEMYASAKFNNASFVYDQVQAAAANTATRIGSIMKNLAASQTNSSSQIDGNVASSSAQLALLRQQVGRLNTLFNTYVQNSKRQFTSSLNNYDGFSDAVQMEARNKMNSVDNSLFKVATELANHQGRIAAEANNLTEGEKFEYKFEHLEQGLEDWRNTTETSVENISNKIETIESSVDPINETTVSMAAMVGKLAAAASEMLSNMGVAVPAVVGSALADPASALTAVIESLGPKTPAPAA
jgi:chromosome segregation ATPase